MKLKRNLYKAQAEAQAAKAKAEAEVIEKKLKKSLDKSSSYNRNMLTIFLGILIYVLITTATTTDMMLLIGSSMIKLPIIGYEVPLLYFYKFTPVIILIIHLYLLINLSIHAENFISWFNIGKNKPSYLVPFVFNYSYKYEQSKLFEKVIKLFIIGVYYILPLFIIGWTAYKFLPYHDFWISIGQNYVVTIDGIMSFLFYRQITRLNNNIRIKQLFIISTVPFMMIVFSWLIFCSVFVFTNSVDDWFGVFHRNIFLQEKAIVSKEISDVMIIHYLHDNKTKEDAIREQTDKLDLHGRDLSYSDFSGSTFINVNLEGANLQGSELVLTRLQGSDLRGANLQWANLYAANLKGANLVWARLQGTYLYGVNLQGANLYDAVLYCSDIDNTTILKGIYYHKDYVFDILPAGYLYTATIKEWTSQRSRG
ncbi:MAG: pentapeptide repeat-containing protein [Nitrospirae bacterium]|nr:pentapeptide repeat-containing protein [Nitrospirota bacterium]